MFKRIFEYFNMLLVNKKLFLIKSLECILSVYYFFETLEKKREENFETKFLLLHWVLEQEW